MLFFFEFVGYSFLNDEKKHSEKTEIFTQYNLCYFRPCYCFFFFDVI